MAAITDKFNKAANGTGAYPSVASVTATREKDGSVLTCDDLAGWATDTPVHFSTYRLMPDGSVDTSTQSDWKGIVSGNTITQVTRLAGNQDSGHLVGDKVELNPTIGWVDDLVTGILKSHNQDGSLKDGIIQAKHIVDKAITSTKLGEKAVKSENVDFGTFPGYTYSTEEQRIGTWIDGKPLYRSVITFPVNNTGVEVTVNAADLNIKEIIDMTGGISVSVSGTPEYYPIQYDNPAGGGQKFYVKYKPGTKILAYYSGYTGTARIILIYTKATD